MSTQDPYFSQHLPNPWRINRQIGIAVVLTLVVQAGTALLWAGRAAERITQLEQRALAQQEFSDRLARLETHMLQTRETLGRIETRLDDRP